MASIISTSPSTIDSTLPTLTYFDGRGSGEIIRLVKVYTGEKFNDYRLQYEKYLEIVPELKYGYLPRYVDPNNKDLSNVAQSITIARYLSEKHNIAGSNEIEKALINQIIDPTTELLTKVFFIAFPDFTEDKEEIKKFEREDLPKYLRLWENRLNSNSNGNGYLVGNSLTLADLAVFNAIDYLRIIKYKDVEPDSKVYPKLLNFTNGKKLPIPLASERRSTRFVGGMVVSSLEKNITIEILPGSIDDTRWTILKNGFHVLESKRMKTERTEDDRGMIVFKCVTSFDTGVYKLRQKDSTNTGFNAETLGFNLTVQGPDSDTLIFVRSPSRKAISGSTIPIQPIIGFGRREFESVSSKGNIEAFIAYGPNGQVGNGEHNFVSFFSKREIDLEKKETYFEGIAIIGDPGLYRLGFVDQDTCEVAIMDYDIEVMPIWHGVATSTVLSLVFGLVMILLTIVLKLLANWKINEKHFMSFRHTIVTPVSQLVEKRGEALRIYFKALRLLGTQTLFFAFLSLVLLVPITIRGNNKLYDIFLISQSNWSSESAYLFIYQAFLFLLFGSFLIVYTRFNDERIYMSHDSNHLVSSRTVLLTGLPKSLIDCNMLKDFLQTSYSKGIYALNIILEKYFTNQDMINDLNGRTEYIYTDNNNGEQSTIVSTGKAFITFSCVSDAHLFKTQFSPHKWSWAKAMSPVPPEDYKAELLIKKWKAYQAPNVQDILWTKLHNPSNHHSVPLTILLLILCIFFFSTISMCAIILFDSQFSRISDDTTINFKSTGFKFSLSVYFVYIFVPCMVLLVINRIIPKSIANILEKSGSFVRSNLKSRIMFVTFLAQAISIVVVPSTYFSLLMSHDVNIAHPNSFFYPINFFRTGVEEEEEDEDGGRNNRNNNHRSNDIQYNRQQLDEEQSYGIGVVNSTNNRKPNHHHHHHNQNNNQNHQIDDPDNQGEELQEKKKFKETILNLKQTYINSITSGLFSFMYSSRYKLPSPKCITITTYSSPLYTKEISQCDYVVDV
eukprot:gene7651-9410_t